MSELEFKYVALSDTGKKLKGKVSAEFRDLALEKLNEEGMMVISLDEIVVSDIALKINEGRKFLNKHVGRFFSRGIKKRQVESFREELDLIGYTQDEISDLLRGVIVSTFDIDSFRDIVPTLDDIQVEKIRAGRLNRSIQSRDSGEGFIVTKKKFKWSRGVSDDELVIFTEQLSILLATDVDLRKALDTIHKNVKSDRLKSAIESVIYDLTKGSTFSDALAVHDTVFHSFYIALVKIGESSGSSLPSTLTDLTKFLKMKRFVKNEAVKASIYPAVLLFAVSLVMGFLSFFLIPKMSEIYSSFEMQLPWLTTVVFSVADNFLVIAGSVIASIVAFVVVFLKVDVVRHKLSDWFDYTVLKLPVVKDVMMHLLMFQFTLTLSITLKNDIPMLDSLDLVSNVVGNKYLKRDIESAYYDLAGGKSVSESFGVREQIDSVTKLALDAGEESGQIAQTLERMAEYYDEKLELSLAKIVQLITPISILAMGVLIGPIVIGVLLPIVTMTGQMGNLG